MTITHIFISHAGPDTAAAELLEKHLRNAGHETKIDTQELRLGDDSIDFMNRAIADAHTIVILYSENTEAAQWQNLELHAAFWNEVAQDGAKCMIVRLDDTDLPPLFGPKIYGQLDSDDPASVKEIVEAICKATLSPQPASSVVSEAFRRDSRNPFRHLRAEFFEVEPQLHAKTFALPDSMKLGALEDMKPCILEGTRGTGKSMLLLSLRGRNFLVRTPATRNAPPHFGFYLKLTRGAICNAGARLTQDQAAPPRVPEILLDVAEQELFLQIVESLVSELSYCLAKDLLDQGHFSERAFCEDADELLFDQSGPRSTSFRGLQRKLSVMHKRLADFIRRRFIYEEQVSVPTTTFDLEQLKRLIALVREHSTPLQNSMFVILLDEYENLFPYQRRIVNSLLKLGPPRVSVKIAKRLASGEVPGTTMGQELQEIHDYTRLPLVYNLENPAERRAYRELLRRMVQNMTRVETGSAVDVDALLPVFETEEVETSAWLEHLCLLCKTTPEAFEALTEPKRRDKTSYYGEAARYRAVLQKRGRRAEKRFSGFSDLALLGSGVVRYFQEFLSVAYHLSFATNSPPPSDFQLPPEKQSAAVHLVSQHNLTTLSRNVERYGEALKYFLLDLGDCLRQKLLVHTSEPEAARLTLDDPETLQNSTMAQLRDVLAVGEREGVFQTREGLPAFKPKHGSDPQPAEFNICRVYAPVLQISPRLRWRTKVKCAQLQGLLEPGMRRKALRELRNAVAKPREPPQDQNKLAFRQVSTT